MEIAAIELSEVTINPEDGLELFKKIMAKIPNNYDTTEVKMTAFYRENIRLGEFELSFNESVLDINKVFNYHKNFDDQLRIIKGRKKDIDFGNDGQFYYWLSSISNTAKSSLGEDWIKYREAKLVPFNPKNYRFYNYEYIKTFSQSSENIMLLEITPKKKSRRGFIKTKLYVHEKSLAIVKIDFELTSDGIKYVNKHQKGGLAYSIMSKIVKAKLDFSSIRTSITYQFYQKKWHLHSVQRHWEAQVNSKKREMKDRLWRADMNLIVTEIDKDSIQRFSEGDIGTNRTSINNLISKEEDVAFWENYNILKPELPDSIKSKFVVIDSIGKAISKKATQTNTASHKSNRKNGFTRADTLRGELSPLRSCYDVKFYHLDVAVDIENRAIKGNNLMRFKVEESFELMQIDLFANMKIEKIVYKNQNLPFTREFDAVFIQFPETLSKGDLTEICIYFEGTPKEPDWSIPMNGGFLWDKDEAGNPWVQVVCQGSGASLWWPNKDHLSDEPDSAKIWITIPKEFTEISNGRLVGKTTMPNNQMRYEWEVSYPINNYNITLKRGRHY